MYTCEIFAQCGACFSEIIPDALKDMELLIEEMMGQVLLRLFGAGSVDDVSIYSPTCAPYKLQRYMIQIHAQLDRENFILLPRTEEHLKEAISRCMGTLLRELFLSAEVDTVKLAPAPWDLESTLSYFSTLS